MNTLLLRLAGPMQSWGTQSRFTVRDTGMEPSKSGIIGLLCAALGRPRSAPVADLAALRMGVRVDHEGSPRVDYHTAGGTHRRGDGYGVAQVGGGVRTVVSRRYYLADADFLVGLESDDENVLLQLDRALAAPVWPLYLGRKSFVPGTPVRLPDIEPMGPGLRQGQLQDVLGAYPWPEGLPPGNESSVPKQLRLVCDAADGDADAEVRQDVPLSFESRQFAVRYVTTTWIPQPEASA